MAETGPFISHLNMGFLPFRENLLSTVFINGVIFSKKDFELFTDLEVWNDRIPSGGRLSPRWADLAHMCHPTDVLLSKLVSRGEEV